MAHLNISERRQAVAVLQHYQIRIDPPVIRSLCQEFGCSAGAIRNDIRALKSDADLRDRLAHLLATWV